MHKTKIKLIQVSDNLSNIYHHFFQEVSTAIFSEIILLYNKNKYILILSQMFLNDVIWLTDWEGMIKCVH